MEGPNICVRRAVPSDAERLSELNRQFNGEGVACAEWVRKRLSNDGVERCLVGEFDGRLAGFICAIHFDSLCYVDPVGEITELYVRPDARRLGMGKMLVDAMVRLLRSEGVEEIRLLTGRANAAARALYELCGFHLMDECCYEFQEN